MKKNTMMYSSIALGLGAAAGMTAGLMMSKRNRAKVKNTVNKAVKEANDYMKEMR